MIRRLVFMVSILLLPSALFAQRSWHVDYTLGDNNNAGTLEAPLKTLDAAEDSATTAGDSILAKCGEVWREQMTLTNADVYISSYGTGSAPVIIGSDTALAWISSGTNLWSAKFTSLPSSVYFELKDGTVVWADSIAVGSPAPTANYESIYDAVTDTLKIYYDGGDPDTVFTSVEVILRNYGITANANVDDITIKNIEVKGFKFSGIYATDNSDRWTIQDNTVHHIGRKVGENGSAIRLYDSDSSQVLKNTVYEAGRHGILQESSNASLTYCLIEGNTVWNCYHNNIDIQHSTATGTNKNVIIRYNVSYYTDYGTHHPNGIMILAYNPISNAEIYYNLIYNAYGDGIQLYTKADTIFVYNNTVLWCANGIEMANGDRLTTIKNNIFASLRQYGIWLADTSKHATNKIITNNTVWNVPTLYRLKWTNYTDWETLISNTIYGDNDVGNYPVFTDTSSLDPAVLNLSLQSGSPCIDAGNDVGLTTDYLGNPIFNGIPDIGAYEYQGGVSTSNIIVTRSLGSVGYFGRGVRPIDLRAKTVRNVIGLRIIKK
ncbi:hypothetical protein AMJ80_12415 [bacterium SM23_31]|nr:MAG: hypothetical protein AMJ80_12415 [bacterium SM23_31]